MKKLLYVVIILILAVGLFALVGCGNNNEEATQSESVDATTEEITTATTEVPATVAVPDFLVPLWDGEPSVSINGNVPEFDDALKTDESFEKYSKLDKHGRCTDAMANLSVDTQPAADESRGDIAMVHPSGWMSDQGWERCHLIGWQLAGENDNPRNLITGTHYLNVEGMLPYENEVNTYISETGNHVLYEVTPIYDGKNMVCSGVHMQAESIEDDGEGVSFNVYCFNVKPGYDIDYKTGETTVTDEELADMQRFERGYVLNNNTMKFHYPSCKSVSDMAEHNKEYVTTSREELIKEGYSPCGNCEP
ncbi:MAG: DNA/RNA non-specific endonuclease [Clostridia bacterium]|nr:DNA/RNA non-specific endonuclease [Clostridia bacterium]